jgi:chromosome segregation ATPase
MSTFKTRLEAMDTAHAEKQRREQERQKRLVDGLLRRQEEFEKRAKSMTKTISRIERHHKVQVETAIREGQMLQSDVVVVEAKNQSIADQNSKLQQWKAKSDQLKKQLEHRENELSQARTDNETMKREIARLQHEARVSRTRSTARTKSTVKN